MKKLVLMFCLIVLFIFAGQAAYACTCAEIPENTVVVDKSGNPEKFKEWLLEGNQVAFFIGQVIKIEKVKVKRSSGHIPMKKVTVKVEKYWAGVKSPEMIIYTGMGNGDCGVPYVKGTEYFFGAARIDSLLETDICSARSHIKYKTIDKLNELLGGAKEFL